MLHKQGYMHARPCTYTRALTHAHKRIIFIAFLRQKLFTNAPRCYVVRTLPVLKLNEDLFIKADKRITKP